MKPTTGIDIEYFDRDNRLMTARATGNTKSIPNLTTRGQRSLLRHLCAWLMRKIGGR